MPLRREQLELALDPDAPFFLDLPRAGRETIGVLEDVVDRGDPMLAMRAVLLCGHVRSANVLSVIEIACHSERSVLREAAAVALDGHTDAPPRLLDVLLCDPEPRVRMRALAVVASRPAFRRLRYLRVFRRLRADPDVRVRRLAHAIRALRSYRRPRVAALSG